MESLRSPGQRAGLTATEVRATARMILVESGVDGLTMRGLADRLGVRANAIYSHTANKMTLVDDVLDDVLAEVTEPDPDGDAPATSLHAIMRSTFDVLVAHRRLVPLYVQQQGARGPNAQRLGDLMLQLLERAGITGSAAIEARHVLIVYTIGAAAYQAGSLPTTASEGATTDAQNYEAFLSGLRWLLNGIGA